MSDDKKQDTRELLFRDAQYRKGLSIAFFNATNAAIEMMKATSNVTKENFLHWRDFLLDEHNEYYARVIATVGTHYDVKAAITRLKSAKTMPELRATWFSFSEDERRNGEIIKVTQEMKAGFQPVEPPRVAMPTAKKVAKPKKDMPNENA